MKVGKYIERDEEGYDLWQCPFCQNITGQVGPDCQGVDDVGCSHWQGNGIFSVHPDKEAEKIEKAVRDGIAWKKKQTGASEMRCDS